MGKNDLILCNIYKNHNSLLSSFSLQHHISYYMYYQYLSWLATFGIFLGFRKIGRDLLFLYRLITKYFWEHSVILTSKSIPDKNNILQLFIICCVLNCTQSVLNCI